MPNILKPSQYQDRPLRILQVHTHYPSYVPIFYNLYPHVAKQNFTKQIQKLYEHGMQDMYMVAPLLAKLGCEAQLVYSNTMPAQRAWCMENGLPLDIFDTPNWEQIVLAAQIETFKPDVLFFTDNHHFDGNFLQSLKFQPKLVVAWRNASIDLDVNWQGFDILLSPLRRIRNLALHLGVKKSVPYLFGLSPIFENNFQENALARDIVYCGTYQSPFVPHCHAERRAILDIACHVNQEFSTKLGLFLNDTPASLPIHIKQHMHVPLYGKSMYKEIVQSTIGIDKIGIVTANKLGQTILCLHAGDVSNMRLFEHTAYGVLAFTEYRGRLNQLFKIDEEIVVYRSKEDFEKKLRYYLSHKDEAIHIAKQGKARAKQDYNQTKSLNKLLQIFQQGLAEKQHISKQEPNKNIPPDMVLQKMLKILYRYPEDIPEHDIKYNDAWELEENLFNVACTLATQGEYAKAHELDILIRNAPFVKADMGYLVNIQ